MEIQVAAWGAAILVKIEIDGGQAAVQCDVTGPSTSTSKRSLPTGIGANRPAVNKRKEAKNNVRRKTATTKKDNAKVKGKKNAAAVVDGTKKTRAGCARTKAAPVKKVAAKKIKGTPPFYEGRPVETSSNEAHPAKTDKPSPVEGCCFLSKELADHNYSDLQDIPRDGSDVGREETPDGSKCVDDGGDGGDLCAVCLELPVHPVILECKHRYCYLCAKGLKEGGYGRCSLCRRPIAPGYLKSIAVLRSSERTALDGTDGPQWFYQSGNLRDWWMFEERNNIELEETFESGITHLEAMICGQLYVIDLVSMVQYRKNGSGRVRRIMRGTKSMESLGIAGLAK